MASKHFTYEEIKKKISAYCAYQERCHLEVRNKLRQYGLYGTILENIMAWLITENFLKEERYARTIAGGKFRIKKWGRIKIVQFLKKKQVSDYCIRQAIEEINEDEYQEAIMILIKKKSNQLDESDRYKKTNKIARFMIGKGYEPDLVWKNIRTILPK